MHANELMLIELAGAPYPTRLDDDYILSAGSQLGGDDASRGARSDDADIAVHLQLIAHLPDRDVRRRRSRIQLRLVTNGAQQRIRLGRSVRSVCVQHHQAARALVRRAKLRHGAARQPLQHSLALKL